MKKLHGLEIFPEEVWTCICLHLDRDTLWILKDTNKFFHEFLKPILIFKYFKEYPILRDLFRLTHVRLMDTAFGGLVSPLGGKDGPSSFKSLNSNIHDDCDVNHTPRCTGNVESSPSSWRSDENTGGESWPPNKQNSYKLHQIPIECPDVNILMICNLPTTQRLVYLMHHNIKEMADKMLKKKYLGGHRFNGDGLASAHSTQNEDIVSSPRNENFHRIQSDELFETGNNFADHNSGLVSVVTGNRGQIAGSFNGSLAGHISSIGLPQSAPIEVNEFDQEFPFLFGPASSDFLHSNSAHSLRASTYPPQKYTDQYEEWVHFDPNLEGIDRENNLQQFRNEQGRRGSGVLSRMYVKWDNELQEMIRNLSILTARLWCVLGRRRFPFTHSENKEWKRRRFMREESSSDSKKVFGDQRGYQLAQASRKPRTKSFGEKNSRNAQRKRTTSFNEP